MWSEANWHRHLRRERVQGKDMGKWREANRPPVSDDNPSRRHANPPPPRASLIVSHQKTPSMTTVGRSNGPHKTEYLVPHVLRPVYPCFCGLDPSPIPSLPHRDLPSLRHGLWDACKCRSRVSDGRDTLSSCTLELTRNPCLKIFRRQISVFVSPKQQKHRRQKTKTAPNPLLPVPARQQCK
jgi:hypothetical protein